MRKFKTTEDVIYSSQFHIRNEELKAMNHEQW